MTLLADGTGSTARIGGQDDHWQLHLAWLGMPWHCTAWEGKKNEDALVCISTDMWVPRRCAVWFGAHLSRSIDQVFEQ